MTPSLLIIIFCLLLISWSTSVCTWNCGLGLVRCHLCRHLPHYWCISVNTLLCVSIMHHVENFCVTRFLHAGTVRETTLANDQPCCNRVNIVFFLYVIIIQLLYSSQYEQYNYVIQSHIVFPIKWHVNCILTITPIVQLSIVAANTYHMSTIACVFIYYIQYIHINYIVMTRLTSSSLMCSSSATDTVSTVSANDTSRLDRCRSTWRKVFFVVHILYKVCQSHAVCTTYQSHEESRLLLRIRLH